MSERFWQRWLHGIQWAFRTTYREKTALEVSQAAKIKDLELQLEAHEKEERRLKFEIEALKGSCMVKDTMILDLGHALEVQRKHQEAELDVSVNRVVMTEHLKRSIMGGVQ